MIKKMTTVPSIEKANVERYLIIRVFDDLYGFEIHYLKEVFQTENISTLPRTSTILEGIVNLRGSIVSIFNLSILLWGSENHVKDKSPAEIASKRKIILLVSMKNQDVGILVDQVLRLETLSDFIANDKSYFKGKQLVNPSSISQIGFLSEKQPVFILDIEALLASFISSTKPLKKDKEVEGEEEFDFSQYTLPDPDGASES